MISNTFLNDLKSEIQTGKIIVITGTGTSIITCNNQLIDAHPVACWDGLLLHGVETCQKAHHLIDDKVANLLTELIKSGETELMILAAEFITAKLKESSPGVYKRWLKDSVGRLKSSNPEVLQTLDGLGGVLATLNYDNLIEQATDKKNAFTWLNEDKVQDVLRGKITDAVIHLHGYYDDPDSVVLGVHSYHEISTNLHTKAVLQLFTLDRTILFVGCGSTLQDPHFIRLIKWGNKALKNSTHRHFILCREIDLDNMRRILGSSSWLSLISYGKEFEELLPFLHSLSSYTNFLPHNTESYFNN